MFLAILMTNKPHPYIPNISARQAEMLKEIGVSSIDDLYKDVPEKYFLKKALNIPPERAEAEILRDLNKKAAQNKTFMDMPIFLGGGVWPHHVPAIIPAITSRGEFLTSYTPYQAPISQGVLQTLYEYQSMMAELMNLDVVNASMYDWASAAAEAALMAARHTNREEVVVPGIISSERIATMRTYMEPAGLKITQVRNDMGTGCIDLEDLKKKVSDKTAAVYFEQPNYFGVLDPNAAAIAEIVHEKEALMIAGVDPTSLGVVKSPGDYDADIAVGEGQPLGTPMSYGGPLLGLFACKSDARLIRQMPGRIIGLTTTTDGKERGFCMALAPREQHIRRERATSNICSNQALIAINAAIYMASLGPDGFKQLGETILYNSNYASRQIGKIAKVKAPVFKASHFKEFLVNFDDAKIPINDIHNKLLKAGIHGGRITNKEFPGYGQSMLFCVTEVHTKEDIDLLAKKLATIIEGGF